ncbi:MAG: hypothetical protein R3F51_26700 [Cyanobacteriota/Melainabacteria group bacterium]
MKPSITPANKEGTARAQSGPHDRTYFMGSTCDCELREDQEIEAEHGTR